MARGCSARVAQLPGEKPCRRGTHRPRAGGATRVKGIVGMSARLLAVAQDCRPEGGTVVDAARLKLDV